MAKEILSHSVSETNLTVLQPILTEVTNKIRIFSGGNYRDTFIRNAIRTYCEPDAIDFWVNLPHENTQIRLNQNRLGRQIGTFEATTTLEQITKSDGETYSTIYGFNSERAVKQYINGEISEISPMEAQDFRDVKIILQKISGNIPK
jgi:hypothetical protein